MASTHIALDLLKREYLNYFDFVIIFCHTLKHNETHHQYKWFWSHPYVSPIEPGDHLYNWIKKLGNLLAGCKTLFLTGHIIADETLDKLRQPLLGLAILEKYKGNSLWMLTQSYINILMNIRRRVKMFYIWYPKK